jgi:hypothetical protein
MYCSTINKLYILLLFLISRIKIVRFHVSQYFKISYTCLLANNIINVNTKVRPSICCLLFFSLRRLKQYVNFPKYIEYKLTILLWLKHNENELRYYAPNLCSVPLLPSRNPYRKTKSREVHTLNFRDNYNADFSCTGGKICWIEVPMESKFIFRNAFPKLLPVYDYCVDSSGCEV